MLFTGHSLPGPERRRKSLGVEPMTCAPKALRSGDALVTLKLWREHPGQLVCHGCPSPPGLMLSDARVGET
jgi:hypothetical protein